MSGAAFAGFAGGVRAEALLQFVLVAACGPTLDSPLGTDTSTDIERNCRTEQCQDYEVCEVETCVIPCVPPGTPITDESGAHEDRCIQHGLICTLVLGTDFPRCAK